MDLDAAIDAINGAPDLSEVATEKLEAVYDGALKAERGLGSDLAKRKRGVEIMAELLMRQSKAKLLCYHANQRKWREDLRRRSRQKSKRAKLASLAEAGIVKKSKSKKDGWSTVEEIPELTSKEWKKYEQDKARKTLLTYGLDEWGKIQQQLLDEQKLLVHGISDFRNLGYTFLMALRDQLYPSEDKGEKKGENGAGTGKDGDDQAGVSGSPLTAKFPPAKGAKATYHQAKEEVFLSKKLLQLEGEGATSIVSLTHEWPKIDKLGVSWVRKLRLLDLIREANLLYRDESRRHQFENALVTISESSPPIYWWSKAADQALVFGVYKHGYGNFDKVRHDPEYKEAFTPDPEVIAENMKKKEIFRHKEGCNCVSCVHTRRKRERQEKEGNEAGAAIQGGEEGKANGAPGSGGPPDAAEEWPSVDTLTKRLKRMVEIFAKNQKAHEKIEFQKQQDAQKSQEWTKKDRFILAQSIMRWGTHLTEDREIDWESMTNLSGLTKKNEESIMECFHGLVKEAKSILEDSKKQTSREGEDTSVQEALEITTGDAGASAAQSEVLRKAAPSDTVLTPITAQRLLDRIQLMTLLRSMVKDENYSWSISRQLQGLPIWWKSHKSDLDPTHDRCLVDLILKHGAGKWEDIQKELEEERMADEVIEEEDEDEDQDIAIPSTTVLQKRLKQIISSYKKSYKPPHKKWY